MNLIEVLERMKRDARLARVDFCDESECDLCSEEDLEAIETVLAMQEALREVHKIVSEAAVTGFNPKDGDWADRLFQSQYERHEAIRRAEGNAG